MVSFSLRGLSNFTEKDWGSMGGGGGGGGNVFTGICLFTGRMGGVSGEVYSQPAVGTHPAGMHSCFAKILCRLRSLALVCSDGLIKRISHPERSANLARTPCSSLAY